MSEDSTENRPHRASTSLENLPGSSRDPVTKGKMRKQPIRSVGNIQPHKLENTGVSEDQQIPVAVNAPKAEPVGDK